MGFCGQGSRGGIQTYTCWLAVGTLLAQFRQLLSTMRVDFVYLRFGHLAPVLVCPRVASLAGFGMEPVHAFHRTGMSVYTY